MGMAWWLRGHEQGLGQGCGRGNVGEVGAEVWCGGQSVAGQWYPGATGTAHGSGRGEAGVLWCRRVVGLGQGLGSGRGWDAMGPPGGLHRGLAWAGHGREEAGCTGASTAGYGGVRLAWRGGQPRGLECRCVLLLAVWVDCAALVPRPHGCGEGAAGARCGCGSDDISDVHGPRVRVGTIVRVSM